MNRTQALRVQSRNSGLCSTAVRKSRPARNASCGATPGGIASTVN